MASLDLFIVNVAFGDIGREFRSSSVVNLSWVLNAYAILYAALLVPLGRLADRLGQRTVFLAGLASFTAGSAACAVSDNLWALVAFRGMQAMGAAALTPASLGLLVATTPADRRDRAVRIWAATGALAAAVGPVVGGLLVEASWRWIFLVNVPIGLVALLGAHWSIPDTRHNTTAEWPDFLGGGVLLMSIGTLSLALVKAPAWGWGSPAVMTCFGSAALGAAVFWRRSLHHPSPVVEPDLLRVPTFAWSNATALAFNAAFAADLLSVILWMQEVWHYSALQTGLAVAPGPLMVPLFAALAQRVAHRVPSGAIAAAGCLLLALGNVVLVLANGAARGYAVGLLPAWLVIGAGVGLAVPTILSAATADLPPTRASTGSAVVNMSRQIGASLGVSLLVAILASASVAHDVQAAFVWGWWTIVITAFVGALTALGMTPHSPNIAPPAALSSDTPDLAELPHSQN